MAPFENFALCYKQLSLKVKKGQCFQIACQDTSVCLCLIRSMKKGQSSITTLVSSPFLSELDEGLSNASPLLAEMLQCRTAQSFDIDVAF